jgi:hypothetical protein
VTVRLPDRISADPTIRSQNQQSTRLSLAKGEQKTVSVVEEMEFLKENKHINQLQ